MAGPDNMVKLSVYVYMSFVIFSILTHLAKAKDGDPKLLVLTVATEETDGFKRFMRSAKVYGIDVEVLGMNEEWKGGDVRLYSGGGHKVNLLKAAMQKYSEEKNLIVMFVDSYDVIFMAHPEEILKKFFKTKSKILFSAEGFCWPDSSLAMPNTCCVTDVKAIQPAKDLVVAQNAELNDRSRYSCHLKVV